MNKILVVISVAYSALFIWLFIFKMSYKSTYIKNRISLFVSSFFGIPASYSYSIFATFLYCLLPTVASIIVSKVARIKISELFVINNIGQQLLIVLLGIVAAMSLVSIFIIVTLKISPKIDIPGEMSKVKWIEGIFQTPKKIAWLLPCLSASFEEVFFRGVFLKGLLSNGMNDAIAIVVVTIAFILNQILLTETKVQALILTFSSISISFIGSVMFLGSGGVIPSMIMHASFAGFYTKGTDF